MKEILLLRHAKSSWKNSSNGQLNDIDRPLNKRGLEDATYIGIYLKKLDLFPDLILSSPALRTKQTVDLVKKANMTKNKLNIEFIPSFLSRLNRCYYEKHQ